MEFCNIEQQSAGRESCIRCEHLCCARNALKVRISGAEFSGAFFNDRNGGFKVVGENSRFYQLWAGTCAGGRGSFGSFAGAVLNSLSTGLSGRLVPRRLESGTKPGPNRRLAEELGSAAGHWCTTRLAEELESAAGH